MAKVNLADIAKKTGYSVATVSNALNHKRNVGDKTAEVIRKAAADMGYLRHGSLDCIRLVFARKKALTIDESTHHPYVIEGVEDAAKAQGLQTTVSYLDILGDDSDLTRAQEVFGKPGVPSCLVRSWAVRTLHEYSLHLIMLCFLTAGLTTSALIP